MAENILFSVTNLSVVYPNKKTFLRVLDNFTLHLRNGEIIALVGESGSGKSTAIMAILGLLPETALIEGKISYNGKDFDASNPDSFKPLRGKHFGLIIQEPMSSFNPLMKIGNQILESIHLRMDSSVINKKEKLFSLLEEVGLKETDRIANSFPHQLSGGQLQRAMIAMALAQDPEILIADEPTTALDITVQRKIIKLLLRLREKRNMSIIMVSHDLSLVSNISDHLIIMKEGNIVEEGKTKKVIENPKHIYTQVLLESRPAAHQSGTLIPIKDGTESDKKNTQKKLERKIGKTLSIKADSLYAHYKTSFLSAPFPVLFNVTLECLQGQTIGLVGESGSGKSTFGKILLGIMNPSKGSLEINGNPIWIKGTRNKEAKTRYAQMVFQNSHGSLNRNLKISSILEEPYRLIGIHNRSAIKNNCLRSLAEVGLDSSILDRYPYQLSGGQRQRINIARALASNPSILICDEAVSALDSTVQAGIINLLLRIRSSRNISLVFISHDMDVIHHMSDTIFVMDQGEIVEAGTVIEIFKNPQHKVTKKLIEATYHIHTNEK